MHRFVVPAPALDDYLCLLERVEDLSFQQFILELRVEALGIVVLPRASRLNVSRPGAYSRDPLADCYGYDLGPIARTNVTWNAAQDG